MGRTSATETPCLAFKCKLISIEDFKTRFWTAQNDIDSNNNYFVQIILISLYRVGVKLHQTINAVRDILIGAIYAKRMLGIAVECFRSLKTIGKTSHRLFRGLCNDVVRLISTKQRKLERSAENFKYRMLKPSHLVSSKTK